MFLTFVDRPSDSPYIERVWHCRSGHAGTFLSIAASHFEMVVTRHRDRTFLTLRGPESKATTLDCPGDGEWLGIRFRLGTFMPKFPPADLMDGQDVTLSEATSRSFWLDSSAWDYPDFENAETFVARLARQGILARDGVLDAFLHGERLSVTDRSAQRHFRQATGLTRTLFHQIERARHATNLLRQGSSILDTVHEAGYFDHAHLTRSLKYLIGQTPTEIMRGTEQLSFLYKTAFAR
jgi:hypothetical protein